MPEEKKNSLKKLSQGSNCRQSGNKSDLQVISRGVISYVRCSTQEQVLQGVTLADQQEKIEQYAALYDLPLVERLADEGRSAKDMNRPAMQRVLELIREKKVQAIIVAKLDRLTRSVRDVADIIELCNKNEVSLVSVAEHIDTGTAAGRMIVNMMGVISQWERETIGERTKAALQYKKRNGDAYNGTPPYGFANQDGRLVLEPSEQDTIERVMQSYREGFKVAEICRKLRGWGLKTRNGNRTWHSTIVGKIIKDASARKEILSGLSFST